MACPRPQFLLASALTAFLATFNMAYHAAVINVPEKAFWEFLNETNMQRHGVPMSPQNLNVLWGWIVSIVSVGGFFGSIMAPLVTERFGRKVSLLIWTNLIAIGSSILMAFCQTARSYELLAVGRFLNGFGAGVSSSVLPIYLTESCSNEYRGLMGCFQSLFINFTTILAFVLAIPNALGSQSNLPFLLGLSVVPAALQILSAFFLPESPKFLYIKRRDVAKAEKSLRFWSANGELSKIDMQNTFKDFDDEADALSHEISFINAMKIAYFRKVIFLGMLVWCGPALVGAPAVFSYSTDMFLKLGFSVSVSNINTTMVAVLITVGALAIIPFVDRFPRRKFLFVGYAALILTVFVYIGFAVLYRMTLWSWPAYVALISMQAFAFLYSVGGGAVTMIIPTEIAPQAIRSVTNSLSVGMSWLLWLLVTFLYPILEAAMGPWSFLVFVAPWILILIYLYKELPETGQKSVAEIFREYSNAQMNSGADKVIEILENGDQKSWTDTRETSIERSEPLSVQNSDCDKHLSVPIRENPVFIIS